MRRILAGLKVVRPHCAPGAPPRPRLRSTDSGARPGNEAKQTKQQPIPTPFTGIPNTDKESKWTGDANPIPQPETIFAGIDALEPGSHLTIDADRIRTERWWRLEFKTHDVPVREARERVRELMADSVRLRLRSDVPLGVFLSGGVDSSVIAYEAAQVLGETVHAFTVATGSGLDESAVADRTATSLGIRSTVLPLEFDPLESLHTVVDHYDQPFADSSAIPSLALRRGCLSGLRRQHWPVPAASRCSVRSSMTAAISRPQGPAGW
jgi:asparagine synthetase B (glutamine-hydrolysing)